ncbi:MAG: hypothetical protein ACXVZV_13130 [Terriglobales bacterium]
MTHGQLVKVAEQWLRRYRCGIVLSEQQCSSGEMPDAIGWKEKCRSVVVECKVSRGDFLADRGKAWRLKPEIALGCERFYLSLRGIVRPEDLPKGWGLLEYHERRVTMLVRPARESQRSPDGLMNEMNLLLASLRRVEVRIEPQTITEFLKWKNRMAEYNGGATPEGLVPIDTEQNTYLTAD